MAERADVPQTDREAIMLMMGRMDTVIEKLDGEHGLFSKIEDLNDRVSSLENWRWYVIGGLTLVLVIYGRYLDLAKP